MDLNLNVESLVSSAVFSAELNIIIKHKLPEISIFSAILQVTFIVEDQCCHKVTISDSRVLQAIHLAVPRSFYILINIDMNRIL